MGDDAYLFFSQMKPCLAYLFLKDLPKQNVRLFSSTFKLLMLITGNIVNRKSPSSNCGSNEDNTTVEYLNL
jgi:hypothetical protein